MKLIPLFAILAVSVAASDYENAIKCATKDPDVNTVISQLCAKGDITVPSDYAKSGVKYGGIHVSIHGDCFPLQWVPPQYCNSQFHAICARGSEHGTGHARFGDNDCQLFKINKIEK